MHKENSITNFTELEGTYILERGNNLVFDGHSDIFTDVAIRRLKGETNIIQNYHLDRLKKGNLEGACFVLWVDPPYDKQGPKKRLEEIIQLAKLDLAECQEVMVVRNYKEIQDAIRLKKFYILIGLEGMSGIDNNPDALYDLYNFGVRECMLTWNEENSYATGVAGDINRGLTTLGKKAISIMEEKKIILDVSHLNDKSFWDVINYARMPILASHSNARALANVPRNLDDEQLLAIRDGKGLVCLNAFNLFIHNEKEKQNAENLIRHATYIAEKIGVEHLGFGFDFFEFLPNTSVSGFSDNQTPSADGIEDCSKVPLLLEGMKKVGFTEKELQMIARDNWHSLIKRVID